MLTDVAAGAFLRLSHVGCTELEKYSIYVYCITFEEYKLRQRDLSRTRAPSLFAPRLWTMDGCMDGWKDGRMDGWMGGRMGLVGVWDKR